MIGVNFYIHRIGTVAIFATLFVAIYVNGVRGCVFNFEDSSDFELECNNAKGIWSANHDVKDSPSKKVLILMSEQEGCLKTKEPVMLNSTTPVVLKFYQEGPKNDTGKIILRLIPKDGICSDDECVWDILSDSQYKMGEWISAEHKFPLKSIKPYYVQLQVQKSKGKFLLDRITVQNAISDSSCHLGTYENNINLPKQLTATGSNSSKSASNQMYEICKNLLITSASVLTLNNILN